jgi:hypothetical protein
MLLFIHDQDSRVPVLREFTFICYHITSYGIFETLLVFMYAYAENSEDPV